MNRAVFAIGALLLAGCASPPSPVTYAHQLSRGACEAGAQWGASTQLTDDVAVTNAHAAALLENWRGLLAIDERADLAFYRHRGTPATWTDARPGESVALYGSECGGVQVGVRGAVIGALKPTAFDSCTHCTVGPSTIVLRATGAGPGFSGGPVVNDSGQVIGLTYSMIAHLRDEALAPGLRVGDMLAIPSALVWAEYERLVLRRKKL